MLLKHISKATLLLLALSLVSQAEDKPKDGEDTPLRKLIDESVNWYQLRKSGEEVPMKPVIAMRWPNNTRGSADGATVIWVADGRPEAVCAIYPWQDLFEHQFDSLSRGTVVAERDDEIVWQPMEAGLQFRPIDGAPAPAKTRAARLRQMKALTKLFKATLLGWTNDGSQVEQLRILSRPLYRYEIENPEQVHDGALFAFVTGTDPEVLLSIESFGEPDQQQWQYAFVRRTSGGLEGRFRDKVVWGAGKYPQQRDPKLNHIGFARPLDEALESVRTEATP